MGRIQNWIGTIGAEALADHAERQRTNIEAEDEAVRKALGWQKPKDDKMQRQTILGNVVNQSAGLLKGAALSAALIAGGGGLTYAGLSALGMLKPHQTIIEHKQTAEPIEFDVIVEAVPD